MVLGGNKEFGRWDPDTQASHPYMLSCARQ